MAAAGPAATDLGSVAFGSGLRLAECEGGMQGWGLWCVRGLADWGSGFVSDRIVSDSGPGPKPGNPSEGGPRASEDGLPGLLRLGGGAGTRSHRWRLSGSLRAPQRWSEASAPPSSSPRWSSC